MAPGEKRLEDAVVGVVGAGTMGRGIAQVAAVAGHRVLVFDAAAAAAASAVKAVGDRIDGLVAKGRVALGSGGLDLHPVDRLEDLAGADVVIEAVVEDLEVKRQLFAELEHVVGAGAVLASNTSSLSPTALAAGLEHEQRVVGLHFFNPVPLMRLVEVIPAASPDSPVVAWVSRLAERWGKSVVTSTPTPGFIVNRIARPFYAEAWRLHDEQAAIPAVIDAVLVGAGGFRMGAFELMDLIGHDVNVAVGTQVWSALNFDPRFEPSPTQRALVDAGRLGRKSGRGIYSYGPDGSRLDAPASPAAAAPPPPRVGATPAPPWRVLLQRAEVAGVAVDALPFPQVTAGGAGVSVPAGVLLPSGGLMVRSLGHLASEVAAGVGRPAVVVDRTLDDTTATAVAVAPSDGCPAAVLDEAVGLLQAAGLDVYVVDDAPGLIVTRTVAMLVNVAVDALARGVAGAADIDTAMRLGVNYPLGPLAWGDRWGADTVLTVLAVLDATYGDGRYRPSPLLRRRVLSSRALAAGR